MIIKSPLLRATAIILIFSLTIPLTSLAQIKTLIPAASIAGIIGEVSVIRQGKKLAATKNMTLFIGDEIMTEETSEASIQYDDGSSLFLRKNTYISIQPLPGKPTIGRFIKVMMGQICAKIKPHKEYNTEFETPAAMAVIRGTDIEIEVVIEPRLGWRTVRIGCGDGKFDVSVEEAGAKKTFIIEEGKMALFRRGEKMALMNYAENTIACSGCLLLGAKLLPYILLGALALGEGVVVYQIAKEKYKVICSPAKP